tara:strand:- start:83 stop:550 length:468 start_codon:yes stop_codon:yes gene_type:complete
MFNRILVAGFLGVFVATSIYLWQTSESQSRGVNSQSSSQARSESSMTSSLNSGLKEPADLATLKNNKHTPGLVFDTAPLNDSPSTDPLEDIPLPDLPSLEQQERAAQAIIAEMDRLLEQEGLFDTPLDDEEAQALLEQQAVLQQRLDALTQQFDE